MHGVLVQPGLRICLDNMLPSSRDPRPSSARRHYEWSRCASEEGVRVREMWA
jgi:hypothetical protein